MVNGVSFGWTWYVAPAPAAADAPPSAAAHVFGPTTPSAVKPCWVCQDFVAAAVFGPNFPSCATPTIFCHRATSGPVDPCWIVVCGPRSVEAAGAAATGVVAIGAAPAGGMVVATAPSPAAV